LEINTLPGLTPGFSDLCVQASGEGLSYTNLLLEILYLGASRFGLLAEPAVYTQPARSVRVPLRRPNGRVPAAPLMLE
jgi:D-alanine-D-alanine ligase